MANEKYTAQYTGQQIDQAFALLFAGEQTRDNAFQAKEATRDAANAAALAAAASIDALNLRMARLVGVALQDETTDGTEQWIFASGPFAAGDIIIVAWSCPTTGNAYSIQSGTSSYAYVDTLYHDDATTATSGTWRMTADTDIASLRIFSTATGFRAQVYKLDSANIATILRGEIAGVEESVQDVETELKGEIDDINEQLYLMDTIHEETTPSTEQWIIFLANIAAGDKLTIAWDCPTTGNAFSIERGDSSLAYVETLYHEDVTTTKRGTWTHTAASSIASLRIFSRAAGFHVKVTRGEPQSILDSFGTATPTLSVKTTGLYSISDGSLDSTTAWYGSNCVIPVSSGQVVTYMASPLASGYGVAWMSNGTCIGGEWFDIVEPELKTVVAPVGADEMRISWNRNWVQNQSVRIDNSLDTVRKRLTKAEDDIRKIDLQRPHAGGRILSLGDSYTMMNYYGQWLAEMTGCEQTPRGYNGQNLRHLAGDTYQNTDNWAQDITLPLTTAILKQYDIITIMGGTNDYGQGYAAGTISDSKDADTVAGHIKWLLDKLYTLNPDARIYVCTQPYRVPHPAFHNGAGGHIRNYGGSTLEECMDAVVAVCRYYGVPCFDFYHESGWNEWTNRVTNPEAGEPSASNVYEPFEDNPLTVDGLHPRSGAGHGAQQLGYMFGHFINTH